MKYLKNLSYLFALFSFSCNSPVEKKQEQPSENESSLQTNPTEAGNHSGNSFINTVFNEDSSTIIRFQDLHLMVNYLVGEQDTFSVKATNPDTVAMYYPIPETVEGQNLKILSGKWSGLKVETCYETNLSINFGGEHFDLTDWKHFTSDWKVLTEDVNGYRVPEITLEESKQFPKYTVAELKQKAVEDKLDGVYTQKNGTPIVGVSRVFVRISGFHKKQKKSCLLIFEEPMGC